MRSPRFGTCVAWCACKRSSGVIQRIPLPPFLRYVLLPREETEHQRSTQTPHTVKMSWMVACTMYVCMYQWCVRTTLVDCNICSQVQYVVAQKVTTIITVGFGVPRNRHRACSGVSAPY